MKKIITPIWERQRSRLHINIKQKEWETVIYIYTKIETLFKKQDNLRYVFIHKNPDT